MSREGGRLRSGGMTGVILGAASCGLPVVLDGFLSYASALAACRIAPAAHPYLVPSHLSAEKGADRPGRAGSAADLDMDMRLGGAVAPPGDAPAGCRQRDGQPDGNAGAEQHCAARYRAVVLMVERIVSTMGDDALRLQRLLPDRLGQEVNLRRGAHAVGDNMADAAGHSPPG